MEKLFMLWYRKFAPKIGRPSIDLIYKQFLQLKFCINTTLSFDNILQFTELFNLNLFWNVET